MGKLAWHGPAVETDGDAAIPRRFTVHKERVQLAPFDPDADGEFAIELEVAVSPGGRARCVGFAIRAEGDQPVTGTLLHKTPIATLVRLAKAEAGSLIAADGTPAKPGGYQHLAGDMRRPKRGVQVDDDLLDRVAAIYREAARNGDHPRQAVCMNVHRRRAIPASTAARWIALARERGILEPIGWDHGA